MKSRDFLRPLNLQPDALMRISTLLDKIETGTEEILTTPLVKETAPEDILKGWDSIFNSNISKMNVELLQMEENNRSKFGPRSIAIPWKERREATLSTFGNSDLGSGLRADTPTRNRLSPLSLENAVQYLKNSTNSGLPFMVKKVNIKANLVSDYDSLIKRKDPAVLFTRTQENRKTRDVNGYPVADTLLEMRYFQPLLRVQRTLPWRSALLTSDDVDSAVSRIYKQAISESKTIVSIDFSSYDKSVKGGLQKSAFDYIRGCFQKQFHDEINYIADRFLNIGLVTPDGIISGPHGVPSGSTFTNEVDSIVQYLVASNCSSVDTNYCSIQGDDGVYFSSDPDDLFSCFEKVGLDVNKDKSLVSNSTVNYLQLLYHSDYNRGDNLVGVYSTYRALIRLVYPERFEDFSKDDISGKDYFAIRSISIIENCKNHPLFKEFVEYVYKLDKYKLSFSDLGLVNYIKRINRQEGKDITFTNWQYGDNISGIRSFETYKLLKSIV